MDRRAFLIGTAGTLLARRARALGGASSPDPYIMPELPGSPSGNQNYGGRSQVSALPVGGSTGVMISFGDSLMSNTVNSLYTPAQGLNQNFDVYNGGVYTSKEPLLGCQINSSNLSSGCWMTRAADTLITNGVYTRFIHVPIAVGGSLLADYAAGGAINGRFAPTKARLVAAGLTPTGIFCMLGANDTNVGTLQAAATASMASIISTLRGLWSCNIFVATHSLFNLATSAGIQAAQASVIDNVTIFSGGNMDSLNGAGNYWDNTHYNATGAAAAAALAVTQITAHP